jgi:hypothetical protein
MPEPIPQPIEPPPARLNRISDWAVGHQIAEGWFVGSRSQKNQNPGNLKATTLTMNWGGVAKDKATDGGYFAVYPDYKTGFQALCNFLTLAAENQLIPYHKARSLRLFCRVYADPISDGYAETVARHLGVPLDTPISDFL